MWGRISYLTVPQIEFASGGTSKERPATIICYLQSAKSVSYDILRPFHVQVARRVNSWRELEQQKLLMEEWMWFVRCAIMEFGKGIFQFTYASTELFDLAMEFNGIREDKAEETECQFRQSLFPNIKAGHSKTLNVYFRVPDDVPVALMTNESPVWTDSTAA